MIIEIAHLYKSGIKTTFRERILCGWKRHAMTFTNDAKVGEPIEFVEVFPGGQKRPFQIENFRFADNWRMKHDIDDRPVHSPLIKSVEPFRAELSEEGIAMTVGDLVVPDVELLDLIATNEGFDDHKEFVEHLKAEAAERGVEVLNGFFIGWYGVPYAIAASRVL